jgi:hypothetical protein
MVAWGLSIGFVLCGRDDRAAARQKNEKADAVEHP